jgi:hypothetical protein
VNVEHDVFSFRQLCGTRHLLAPKSGSRGSLRLCCLLTRVASPPRVQVQSSIEAGKPSNSIVCRCVGASAWGAGGVSGAAGAQTGKRKLSDDGAPPGVLHRQPRTSANDSAAVGSGLSLVDDGALEAAATFGTAGCYNAGETLFAEELQRSRDMEARLVVAIAGEPAIR